MFAVYVLDWTESESGWGQRPDGTTYHKTKQLALDYKKEHDFNGCPEIYTFSGQPYLLEVSKEIFDEVQLKDFMWAK